MKNFIVGAGATFAEALALGNAQEACPPLIRDFACKTWSNYSPHPMLEVYLRELGYQDFGHDPREMFYELEEKGVTNIEHFMEFAWENRNRRLEVSRNVPPGYISGLRVTVAGSPARSTAGMDEEGFWENLLYHGIGSPLSFLMGQCFFENGKGWRDLQLSKSVAARIKPDDLVLNLNYDTVFELALEQLGRPFAYSPNQVKDDQLLVCKPHGSLNMVINDSQFTFGQPEWLGTPQPQGYRSYSGLIPPRLNKHYAQHPIAQIILTPVHDRRPQTIVMWGVGLTESDQDLIALYLRWSEHADVLDIINPSSDVAAKARKLFNCEVRHFDSVLEWEQRQHLGPA
jgi:hypothetical protein